MAVAGLIAVAAVAVAPASVLQRGNLRITLLSQIQPHKLPRQTPAPIAVFLSGHVDAVQKGVPPQLQRLSVKVNRHGKLDGTGLPVCPLSTIQPSTTERAVDVCGPALIGSGQFWAHIVLPDQAPYPTHGRLLVFNGRTDGGRPAILAHIYTADPFATSFVIAFRILRLEGRRRLRDPAERLFAAGARRMGVRRSDQAHPAAQVPLPRPTAQLLQRHLPGAGGDADGELPDRPRHLLLCWPTDDDRGQQGLRGRPLQDVVIESVVVETREG